MKPLNMVAGRYSKRQTNYHLRMHTYLLTAQNHKESTQKSCKDYANNENIAPSRWSEVRQ